MKKIAANKNYRLVKKARGSMSAYDELARMKAHTDSFILKLNEAGIDKSTNDGEGGWLQIKSKEAVNANLRQIQHDWNGVLQDFAAMGYFPK